MQLSVSTLAFNDVLDERFYELLSDYSVNFIDIAPTQYFPLLKFDITIAEKFRKIFTKYSLKVKAMQSLFYGSNNLNIFNQSEVDWSRLVEHFNNLFLISNFYNINNLIFGSPNNRDPGELDRPDVLSFAKDRFYELGTLCKAHKLYLCIEPVPKIIGGHFLCNTEETIKFVTEVGHPSVAVNLDTAALHLNGEYVDELLKLGKHNVRHIHISEPGLKGFETPDVDHFTISSALKRFGYSDSIAIEMLHKNENDLDRLENALKFVIEKYRP